MFSFSHYIILILYTDIIWKCITKISKWKKKIRRRTRVL